MPRFFFDYRDSQGHLERDEEGVEFPSLEEAYEDAAQAAVDIHADACCAGKCLTGDAFEIRDECGRILAAVRFAEALARRHSSRRREPTSTATRGQRPRSPCRSG